MSKKAKIMKDVLVYKKFLLLIYLLLPLHYNFYRQQAKTSIFTSLYGTISYYSYITIFASKNTKMI